MKGIYIFMKIISTIGQSLDFDNCIDLVKRIMLLGENCFRFNFSKYCDDMSFRNRALDVLKIKEKYGDDISIMIDIPSPFKKPRILLNNRIQEVFNHNQYFLKSNTMQKECNLNELLVDIACIGEHVSPGDELIYSDGDGILVVEEVVNRDTVLVRPHDCFTIHTRKSLYVNHILKPNRLSDVQMSIISKIQPDYLALSFVEDCNDIKYYKNMFEFTKLISKIESDNGIENINTISLFSDVMIARGDLMIYSNPLNLYENQDKIVRAAKNNNSKK